METGLIDFVPLPLLLQSIARVTEAAPLPINHGRCFILISSNRVSSPSLSGENLQVSPERPPVPRLGNTEIDGIGAVGLQPEVSAPTSCWLFHPLCPGRICIPLHRSQIYFDYGPNHNTQKISQGQQNCKVFGRLIRLWDAINMKSKFADPLISIDGILLDEDGAMAQISIPKRFVKQFRPLLTEGSVYSFTDITAIDNQNKAYIYHHQKYILQFKYNTKIHQLDSRGANIPKFSFSLCPFEQLPEKNIPSKPLVDIIGVISYVGPFDYASQTSQNKRRIIKIRNLDEETHEIRLWGQYGESFDEEAVLEKSKQGIVIGIFAGLTEGEFLGTRHASSSSATRIYLDPDIPEIKTYCKSYKWGPPTLQQQLPQVIQLSLVQAAGKLYTLAQISAMPDSSFQGGATYSTVAKITSIIPSAKWYYKACKHCDQGYNNYSDTPNCGCPVSYPKPMYKLPLELTDASGSLNAIAFSSIAENLVERDAIQASQNMKIDAEDHVITLNNALGKTKLFYIGMKTDSTSKFPISHVIRRCFSNDNTDPLTRLPNMQPSQGKEMMSLPATGNPSSHSPPTHSQEVSQDGTPPKNVSATYDTEETNISGTHPKNVSATDDTEQTNIRNSAKGSIDFTEDVNSKFQRLNDNHDQSRVTLTENESANHHPAGFTNSNNN